MGSGLSAAGEHVAILLGTRDGQRFLSEQLLSYLAQNHSDWSLHVSDDGSSDATHDLIANFADSSRHEVRLREGPRRGFSQNFLSLAQDRNMKANFFAFSDQDDIWYPDKLERALNFLRKVPQEEPAMYCCRTELVDEQAESVGFSPLFVRPPTFRNALVQSIGGGNTMVFNAAAKRLLEASPQVEIVSHDWWVYLAVSAAGGTVFYDRNPSLQYRQHDNNLVGSNADLRSKFFRLRRLLSGRMAAWTTINVSALRAIRSHFHPANLETFDAFIAAHNARWFLARLFFLYKSGVYRQTPLDQILLYLAAAFGKL
jgi:glycosyltransferase involved in cell wall biosynthesis